MATIITAKEYNSDPINVGLRFRTDSGKQRETGYVVLHDNGAKSWYSNKKKAQLHINDMPEDTTSKWDFNS